MLLKIGPLSLAVGRKDVAVVQKTGGDFITTIPSTDGGWFPIIREAFSGAWQRNITTTAADALSHPTFWACVTLIAGDIAKMRPMLMEESKDGVDLEVSNPAYSPVLRKPNHFQNRIQFLAYWVTSLLTRGNTYILKERDNRNVVTGLYILDPARVRPLVAPNGDVYYSLGTDALGGVDEEGTVVPAREIIHDRINAIYHPLVGLSPVFACGHAALQGLKIMRNTTNAAENGSMIGGLLVAPGQISELTAKRLEDHWNANYTGAANAGKVAAIGDGLKFEKPNVMSAVDAQIIDQLKWGDEKVCATVHVPPYMVGVGPLPSYNNVEALGLQYFGQCLQIFVESIELCLTEGLDVKEPAQVELDVSALTRMDSVQKMDAATKGVVGGIYSPNEARAMFGLKPVKGGATPYLQVQNYSLEALALRDSMSPPPVTPGGPAPVPEPPKPVKELETEFVELAAKLMMREALA